MGDHGEWRTVNDEIDEVVLHAEEAELVFIAAPLEVALLSAVRNAIDDGEIAAQRSQPVLMVSLVIDAHVHEIIPADAVGDPAAADLAVDGSDADDAVAAQRAQHPIDIFFAQDRRPMLLFHLRDLHVDDGAHLLARDVVAGEDLVLEARKITLQLVGVVLDGTARRLAQRGEVFVFAGRQRQDDVFRDFEPVSQYPRRDV